MSPHPPSCRFVQDVTKEAWETDVNVGLSQAGDLGVLTQGEKDVLAEIEDDDLWNDEHCEYDL